MNTRRRGAPAAPPTRRRALMLTGLLVAGVALFLLDVATGPVRVPLRAVWGALLHPDAADATWTLIVRTIRLPRATAGLLAGAALATAGLQMQTLFRNPLAGPSVLGITAGAGLGVAAVVLASGAGAAPLAAGAVQMVGSWGVVAAATLGAAGVMALVLLLSLRLRDPVVLLVAGLMIGQLTLAVVGFWQYFSAPEQLQTYLLWTFGSLGGVTAAQLPQLAAAVGAGLLLTLFVTKQLNALLLGETYARSLGVRLRTGRTLVVLAASLLAGSVTAFCGPIGFVGIAVPHLARGLFGTSDHRWLLPASALLGAVLLLTCDLLAQWPGRQVVLPLNVVTALLGAPVVIWVVVRRGHLFS